MLDLSIVMPICGRKSFTNLFTDHIHIFGIDKFAGIIHRSHLISTNFFGCGVEDGIKVIVEGEDIFFYIIFEVT